DLSHRCQRLTDVDRANHDDARRWQMRVEEPRLVVDVDGAGFPGPERRFYGIAKLAGDWLALADELTAAVSKIGEHDHGATTTALRIDCLENGCVHVSSTARQKHGYVHRRTGQPARRFRRQRRIRACVAGHCR